MHSFTEKLASARRDLLDLSLRNSLINYCPLRSKGIEVVDEIPREIYRHLVENERAMYFVPAPSEQTAEAQPSGTESFDAIDQPEEEAEDGQEPAERHTDRKLQTPYSARILQTRLRNTEAAARSSIEEQGVNILFLAIGALEWYESEASQSPRRAPLILVPVNLIRSSIRSRFRIEYSGEEIGGNLSLQAKLKQERRIEIPDLPDVDALAIDDYLKDIARAVKSEPRWSVDFSFLAVSFFFFSKFLMFKDLDPQAWPEEQSPERHPLIVALLETGFTDAAPNVGEGPLAEQTAETAELDLVVDADSSQTLAINDVATGRNLVIQGPPGTGKSQTITNLIAKSLADGRTVLFVAEKMAALEVVKRRLDNVGLGPACLELHSHMASRAAVLRELRATLDLGRPVIRDDFATNLESLEASRARLNDYAAAVNTVVGDKGVTPYQCFGKLLRIETTLRGAEAPKMDPSAFRDWNQSRYHENRELVADIQTLVQRMGIPTRHVFWGCKLETLLPTEEEPLRKAPGEAQALLTELTSHANGLADLLTLPRPGNFAELQRLIDAARRVLQAPSRKLLRWKDPAWLAEAESIRSVLTAGQKSHEIRHRYDSVLIPEAWQSDVIHLRQPMQLYADKWWRSLIPSFRAASRQLAGLCRDPLPRDGKVRRELVDLIPEVERNQRTFEEGRPLLERLFGQTLGTKTDWKELIDTAEWMRQLHEDVQDGKIPSEILEILATPTQVPGGEKIRAVLEKVAVSSREYRSTVRDLIAKLHFDEGERFSDGEFEDQSWELQAEVLDRWNKQFESIWDIIRYNQYAARLRVAGLEAVLQISSSWDGAGTHLVTLFDRGWYVAVLDKAMRERPALSHFDGETHGRTIERFQQLDLQILNHNRSTLAARHWSQLPRHVAGGQLGILLREFEKKRRHLPIRQLLLQAGEVIQTIKPVFMMSPLSIAKFIPPGSLKFDLVIFDEASQVEPVDAFGALLRARQAVVVGDNKQLPPTRFFERVTESEEVESSPTADLESILGLFCSQGVLQRMLRWHYRSRHESLIRVSNHQFYDGKLVLFPSPDSRREEVGLVFRYLPHTAYEPGLSKRYNLGEALAVAQAVMRHARDYPELTLGVAAFSQAQAQAIDDQLEILRRRDPSLERFFAEHREEPFFVKNLENVQGDERDVIFISVGYGKQADGYMAMSFGPLNWDGGERRLNVLITRARRRCVVFANFRADDIDLSRTSARGVVALKRYLKYAETGIDDLAVPGSREPDSEFEIHVAREIEKLGYQVVPQVGTGGFFIDLAVVDPEQPGRYLLGIECDGATYHSAKSVRDRDRLRQAVLENLGWTLHRIWSTDWFRNPEQELRRLEQAIKSARNERKASTTPPLPPPAQEPSVTRETGVPAQAERAVQPYEIAQFELDLGGLQLHEVPVEKMADWVERVVEVESPIHVDELARRVTAGAGLSRTGSRIQRKVLEAALWALLNERIRQKGDFYFSKDGLVKLRDRSELPPGSKNIAWVAPEEIHQAALLVVTHSFGISREEAVVDVARLLGFQRTGSDVSDRINGILDQMVTEGFLTEKENHLRRAPVPDLEAKQTAEPGAEQDGAEGVQQAGPTLLRLYSMMSPEEQAGLRRQLSSVNTASVASSASLEGNGPVDPISNDPCATDAS